MRDDMMTVIHMFRDFLGRGLALPRPAAVSSKQAMKDAARCEHYLPTLYAFMFTPTHTLRARTHSECIVVDGELFANDYEGMQQSLKTLILPLIADEGPTCGSAFCVCPCL